MSKYNNEQEEFWAGEFGDEYIGRNAGDALLASNLAFFAKALARIERPQDCIEFGSNIGMNLRALRLLFPGIDVHAIEINKRAAAELRKELPQASVHEVSIVDFDPARAFDLAFIKGVLIHLNPAILPKAYDRLHAAAGRHLLVAEYYNPSPVEISYRGHSGRLFKRDFGGELLDRFDDLRLADYGFAYRRDPSFPQDDITWWLFEKR